MSTETNHNAQADGETPPAFRDHAEEIAWHQEQARKMGQKRTCRECGGTFTPQYANDAECARCYVARKF